MQYHEVANIFPLLDGNEFATLKNDIAQNGLLEPIWLHPDGRIIDGRNRHRACVALGIEPQYRTWSGGIQVTCLLRDSSIFEITSSTNEGYFWVGVVISGVWEGLNAPVHQITLSDVAGVLVNLDGVTLLRKIKTKPLSHPPYTSRGGRHRSSKNVYFITDGEFVKIGVAKNPHSRLQELQTGNARSLTLLGAVEGGESVEREIHDKFRQCHFRGEWFFLSDRIVDYIKRKCA